MFFNISFVSSQTCTMVKVKGVKDISSSWCDQFLLMLQTTIKALTFLCRYLVVSVSWKLNKAHPVVCPLHLPVHSYITNVVAALLQKVWSHLALHFLLHYSGWESIRKHKTIGDPECIINKHRPPQASL